MPLATVMFIRLKSLVISEIFIEKTAVYPLYMHVHFPQYSIVEVV